MLYKVSPLGYFGRVDKISRGPWFQEEFVEEDGLEYFYVFGMGGHPVYLLTNNIPLEDREKIQRLYYGLQRNRGFAWFAGLWLGVETVIRVPYFSKFAIGWKCLSILGCGFLYKTLFSAYNA